jgi:hypothetical protein
MTWQAALQLQALMLALHEMNFWVTSPNHCSISFQEMDHRCSERGYLYESSEESSQKNSYAANMPNRISRQPNPTEPHFACVPVVAQSNKSRNCHRP